MVCLSDAAAPFERQKNIIFVSKNNVSPQTNNDDNDKMNNK